VVQGLYGMFTDAPGGAAPADAAGSAK
jgi:hypothetical protein